MAAPWDSNELLNYGTRRKAVRIRKGIKRRTNKKARREWLSAREARKGSDGLKAAHWYY